MHGTAVRSRRAGCAGDSGRVRCWVRFSFICLKTSVGLGDRFFLSVPNITQTFCPRINNLMPYSHSGRNCQEIQIEALIAWNILSLEC